MNSRQISSWWVYRAPSDIAALRELKGVLDSISIHYEERYMAPSFVAQCKELGWEVLRLVDHRSGPYSTEEEVKETGDGLVESCLEKGFDGIDLDYEFLPPESRPGYTKLMEYVSRELKARGKKLSICVGYHPGAHQNPPDHGFIDAEAAGRYCDQIRVMCYDQYFGPGKGKEPYERLDCQGIGPSSTQPWARHAMQHWAKYAPIEKLVMGLPAYSNDYDTRPGGGGRHIYAPYPPANNWITDKTWLWYDKIHVYRYYDENDVPHIFYANDADSTQAHLETATELGVSTISFWHGRSVTKEMWKVASEWRNASEPS